MATNTDTNRTDFRGNESGYAGDRRSGREHDRDRGLVGTMMRFGEATTRFTLDQMQTAATLLIHPSRAIEHMKDSMATISKALNQSVENGENSGSERRSRHTTAGYTESSHTSPGHTRKGPIDEESVTGRKH